MLIVLMGVAGAGKTTVGAMLAGALRCEYLDADTLHSPAHRVDHFLGKETVQNMGLPLR